MEKTGCKIICGAPTTLAVKGLMMMMMMMMMKYYLGCGARHTLSLSLSRLDFIGLRDPDFPVGKFPRKDDKTYKCKLHEKAYTDTKQKPRLQPVAQFFLAHSLPHKSL